MNDSIFIILLYGSPVLAIIVQYLFGRFALKLNTAYIVIAMFSGLVLAIPLGLFVIPNILEPFLHLGPAGLIYIILGPVVGVCTLPFLALLLAWLLREYQRTGSKPHDE